MRTPRFSAKSELVRYVDEINRLRNRRPAVAAFLPDPPSADPANDHLSVNSLEVESIDEIAAYHRWKWQSNAGRVALCVHKVHDYNDAAKKSEVPVIYDPELSKWQFSSGGSKLEDAYRHRPVPMHNNPLGSPSHSGVEFARALKGHNAGKFARRLSGRRFHLR